MRHLPALNAGTFLILIVCLLLYRCGIFTLYDLHETDFSRIYLQATLLVHTHTHTLREHHGKWHKWIFAVVLSQHGWVLKCLCVASIIALWQMQIPFYIFTFSFSVATECVCAQWWRYVRHKQANFDESTPFFMHTNRKYANARTSFTTIT